MNVHFLGKTNVLFREHSLSQTTANIYDVAIYADSVPWLEMMGALSLHTIIEEQQQKVHALHCSHEKNQILKQYASLSPAVILQAG